MLCRDIIEKIIYEHCDIDTKLSLRAKPRRLKTLVELHDMLNTMFKSRVYYITDNYVNISSNKKKLSLWYSYSDVREERMFHFIKGGDAFAYWYESNRGFLYHLNMPHLHS